MSERKLKLTMRCLKKQNRDLVKLMILGRDVYFAKGANESNNTFYFSQPHPNTCTSRLAFVTQAA